MNRIVLTGCKPEPLLSYLKALGVFRLISEQIDKTTRAAWEDDVFVLYSNLNATEVFNFFAQSYCPTPIVGPWAGGSGFFEDDNKDALQKIAKSTTPRLALFRQTIKLVVEILVELNQLKKPQDDAKDHLLRQYRYRLPDEFVAWMDSAVVLQNEGQKFPPVLGTGGNDGRLDFTQNLMQRLVDMGLIQDILPKKSRDWLQNALWGEPISGLSNNKIGQFDPGKAGGPNTAQGLDGDSFVNPWEYVLMLEGALLMAGSVTRRLDANATDKAAFPFTVNVSALGNGSVGMDEDSRGELWCPFWRNPVRLSELKSVFAEGRAQVGTRQARNTVDFARAVAELGVDRGLTGFVRYGFLKRYGKAFIATSLGRFDTQNSVAHANLLSEVDEWLSRYRAVCLRDNVQARFRATLRRLETAIFAYSRFGDVARFGEILRALGACEQALAHNHNKLGVVGKSEQPMPPAPYLSAQWVLAAQEDSPEFRIALALAAMRQTGPIGALRTNMECVVAQSWGWKWESNSSAARSVWSNNSLVKNLNLILEQRLLQSTRTGSLELPLESTLPASLEDINAFIMGNVDDQRIEEWLWGLILTHTQEITANQILLTNANNTITLPLPRAYALLKLLFLPAYSALQTGDGRFIKPEPAILHHLQANQLPEACRLAMRRLHVSGYVCMPAPTSNGQTRASDFTLMPRLLNRLSAALLIPLAHPSRLQPLVLRPNQTQN